MSNDINYNNEIAKFLISNYKDENFTSDKKRGLISGGHKEIAEFLISYEENSKK